MQSFQSPICMWQAQTWTTRKETLLLLVCWIIITSLTCRSYGPSCNRLAHSTQLGNLNWQPTNLSSSIHFSFLRTYSQKYNYYSWDLICPDVLKKVKWLRRGTLTIFLKSDLLTQCAPPFSLGIESPTKFSKKGTWQDLNFQREVAGNEGVTFLSRGRNGSQLLHKK